MKYVVRQVCSYMELFLLVWPNFAVVRLFRSCRDPENSVGGGGVGRGY